MSDNISDSNFKTGLIEGFYGSPWTWDDRYKMVDFLKQYKFGYYIYAPKSDRKLREEWSEVWNNNEYEEITGFRNKCRDSDIDFGIGLSPFELYLNWSSEGKDQLKNKILQINELEPDILWILFDDMKGDRSNMADIQIEISHFILSLSTSGKIAMCPTYYSFDPVLKALFGDMPENYLDTLALGLNRNIDIIWTGPNVCSKEITVDHLKKVNKLLNRKPLLWDNYPVNDSPRMTPFLNLGGFRNRSREIRDLCSGHTINPMVQPCLSRLPLATLNDLYIDDDYDCEKSWCTHARDLLGNDQFKILKEDLEAFEKRGVGSGGNSDLLQDWKSRIEGTSTFSLLSDNEKRQLVREREDFESAILNSLTSDEKATLINKYSTFNSDYFKEVVDWLKGKYSFDPAILDN